MTDTAVIDSIAASRRTELTEPLGTRFDGLDLRDHLTPAFGTMLRALAENRPFLVLLAAILATLRAFWRVDRPAGLLLLPYIAWVSFATVLNLAIWRLN